MIINKGSINDIIVTVTEQTTLSFPVYYLFEFIADSTKIFTYCIVGPNLSLKTNRYDEFQITETLTPSGAGQISLPIGDYHYNIYQQASSSNLDPTLTTVASSGKTYVETGKCTVFGTATTFTQYSLPTSNTQYGPQ